MDDLPATIGVDWRDPQRLRFWGYSMSDRYVDMWYECERSVELIERLYARSHQSKGEPQERPEIDRRIKMRWCRKGNLLRFYTPKGNENFEVDQCPESNELRTLLDSVWPRSMTEREITAQKREKEDGFARTFED